MNTNIFVNEAITSGIENYLNKVNEDDFMTIVIKTLIAIYGELDIINPYKTKNESSMGGFDDNFDKFGYSKENISLFKQNVMDFYLTKDEKDNKYFNVIEKQLIDMFFLKVKDIDKNKINFDDFKKLISFEDTDLNETYSTDKKEITRYYRLKEKELDFDPSFSKMKSNTLSDEAYLSLGYSLDNIKNMNEQQILEINNKVFDYYNIDKTKEDKYIRLEQALLYFKEFPKKEEPKKENGYTEIFLIGGFVLVSLIVITIIVGVLH